jgi:hypothetical protein
MAAFFFGSKVAVVVGMFAFMLLVRRQRRCVGFVLRAFTQVPLNPTPSTLGHKQPEAHAPHPHAQVDPQISSKQITARLVRAGNATEVFNLVCKHGKTLDLVSLNAAMNSLIRMVQNGDSVPQHRALPVLCQELGEQAHEMDARILTTAMTFMSRVISPLTKSSRSSFPVDTKRIWTKFQEQMGKIFPTLNCKHVANMTWALSASGVDHSHAITILAQQVNISLLDQMNAKDISTFLFSLSRADPGLTAPIFRIAEASVSHRIAEFPPRELATVVHAFSGSGHHSVSLIQTVIPLITSRVNQFTIQGLSMIAWALATAGVAQHDVFEVIANRVVEIHETIYPREISNLLWAFARIDCRGNSSHQMFDMLGDLAAKKIVAFSSPQIADVMWSYARVKFDHPILFSAALSALSSGRIHLDRPRDIALTLWSFSQCGYLENDSDPQLFLDLFEKMVAVDPTASSGHTVMGILSFAYSLNNQRTSKSSATSALPPTSTAIQIRSIDILASHTEHVLQRGNLSARDIAAISWALTRAGVKNRNLLSRIIPFAESMCESFTAQNIAALVNASRLIFHFSLLAQSHSLYKTLYYFVGKVFDSTFYLFFFQ